MPKYEISIIVDPKKNAKEVEGFLKDIFGKNLKEVNKLERTELAYEINNSKVAQYFLFIIETTPKNIEEFVRKVNIEKTIWRHIIINLDKEKSIDTVKFIRTEKQVQELREKFILKRKAYFEARNKKRERNE